MKTSTDGQSVEATPAPAAAEYAGSFLVSSCPASCPLQVLPGSETPGGGCVGPGSAWLALQWVAALRFSVPHLGGVGFK